MPKPSKPKVWPGFLKVGPVVNGLDGWGVGVHGHLFLSPYLNVPRTKIIVVYLNPTQFRDGTLD